MTDEQLPDDLRALIAKERASTSLTSEASARIAERLSSTLALSPLPVPAPAPPAGSAAGASGAASHAPAAIATTSAWTAAKLAPIALAFVLGGASGAVITARVLKSEVAPAALQPAHPEPPREQAVAPAPPVIPAPIETPAAPGVEPPVIAAPPHKPEAVAAPDRAETDRDLRAERELIALARRALAEGHAADALAALERHDRRFARGRLAEERDSLRVPALVMLGRVSDASARAAQFHTRYPSSLFAPVVDSALHGAEP